MDCCRPLYLKSPSIFADRILPCPLAGNTCVKVFAPYTPCGLLGNGKRLKMAEPGRLLGVETVGLFVSGSMIRLPLKGSRAMPVAPERNSPRCSTVGTAKLAS